MRTLRRFAHLDFHSEYIILKSKSKSLWLKRKITAAVKKGMVIILPPVIEEEKP